MAGTGMLEEVRQVIVDPDTVTDDPRPEGLVLYRKAPWPFDRRDDLLAVAIHKARTRRRAWFRTAFVASAIPPDRRILWRRP